MGPSNTLAAFAVGAALSLSTPSSAANHALEQAAKLSQLDIMLEVTATRCGDGPNAFKAEYRRFWAAQQRELQAANRLLGTKYRGRAVSDGGVERLGTKVANRYSRGHPWLTCAQLGMVARNLAEVRGTATLEEAADQVLFRIGSRAGLAAP